MQELVAAGMSMQYVVASDTNSSGHNFWLQMG